MFSYRDGSLVLNTSTIIINRLRTQNDQYKRNSIATNLFIRADKDGSHSLDESEVQKMLNELHIKFDKKLVLQYFKEYDKDANGTLDLEEFRGLVQKLMRKPELSKVFSELVNRDDFHDEEELLERHKLEGFYKEHQKENDPKIIAEDPNENSSYCSDLCTSNRPSSLI